MGKSQEFLFFHSCRHHEYARKFKKKYISIILGLKQDKLQNLPVGVAWPLIDIIHHCRECPREDWSVDEYDLLVREDLSSQVKQTTDTEGGALRTVSVSFWNEMKTSEPSDGMDDMDEDVRKTSYLQYFFLRSSLKQEQFRLYRLFQAKVLIAHERKTSSLYYPEIVPAEMSQTFKVFGA